MIAVGETQKSSTMLARMIRLLGSLKLQALPALEAASTDGCRAAASKEELSRFDACSLELSSVPPLVPGASLGAEKGDARAEALVDPGEPAA